MGEWAHISLHGRRSWHVALPAQYLDVGVAPESTPGIRHALTIVLAPSACLIETPAPRRVRTVQLHAEVELRSGCLDVYLVDSPDLDVGLAAEPAWSEPLGPDGAEVQVYARARAIPTIEFAVGAPPDRVREVLAEVEAGRTDHLHVMRSNGGPVVVLEGRFVVP